MRHRLEEQAGQSQRRAFLLELRRIALVQGEQIGDVGVLELMDVRDRRPGLRHRRGDFPPERGNRFPPLVAVHRRKDVAACLLAVLARWRAGAPRPLAHVRFHVFCRDPAAGFRSFHVCRDPRRARVPAGARTAARQCPRELTARWCLRRTMVRGLPNGRPEPTVSSAVLVSVAKRKKTVEKTIEPAAFPVARRIWHARLRRPAPAAGQGRSLVCFRRRVCLSADLSPAGFLSVDGFGLCGF